MSDRYAYKERVSSRRTGVLFLVLSLLFLALGMWRLKATGFGVLAGVFFGLTVFFLFYVLNYRTLVIALTPEALKLRFGLFTWTMEVDNIADCFVDETSLWRIGGAGIHFSWFQGRYRVMFNFLEHPRVVIVLKKKQGPVRDVAFSTRRPDEVLQSLREVTSAEPAPRAVVD